MSKEQQVEELVAEVTGTRGGSEETTRICGMVRAARRAVAGGMSDAEVTLVLQAALVDRLQVRGSGHEAVAEAARRGTATAMESATKTLIEGCRRELEVGLRAGPGGARNGVETTLEPFQMNAGLANDGAGEGHDEGRLVDLGVALTRIAALLEGRNRRLEEQAAESRRALLAGLAVAVLVFVLVAVLGQLQVGRWATAQVAVGLVGVEVAGRREVTAKYTGQLNQVRTVSEARQILGEAVAEATARSRLGAVAVLEEVEGGLWMGPWLVVGTAVLVVVTALGVGGWWWGNRPGPG